MLIAQHPVGTQADRALEQGKLHDDPVPITTL
jgi:hypothetical protein